MHDELLTNYMNRSCDIDAASFVIIDSSNSKSVVFNASSVCGIRDHFFPANITFTFSQY